LDFDPSQVLEYISTPLTDCSGRVVEQGILWLGGAPATHCSDAIQAEVSGDLGVREVDPVSTSTSFTQLSRPRSKALTAAGRASARGTGTSHSSRPSSGIHRGTGHRNATPAEDASRFAEGKKHLEGRPQPSADGPYDQTATVEEAGRRRWESSGFDCKRPLLRSTARCSGEVPSFIPDVPSRGRDSRRQRPCRGTRPHNTPITKLHM